MPASPLPEATAAGPFGDWPLGRGFDRWYGFHGALTDQWHPELFEDNHAVEVGGPDYHLSEDLVDRAAALVRDQQAVAPEQPFFLYLAFGACHWPHHVPAPFLDRYRGRYDAGWDALRQARFERQRALGIVPGDARLPDRNPGVAAWAYLSAVERRVFARLQEAYAAFLEHTDAQIGRLLDRLAEVPRENGSRELRETGAWLGDRLREAGWNVELVPYRAYPHEMQMLGLAVVALGLLYLLLMRRRRYPMRAAWQRSLRAASG